MLPRENEPKKSTPGKDGFTLIALGIVTFQIGCEVSKQLSNYSTQYYNGGHYPIPQTVIVAIMETIKLITTVIRSKGRLINWSYLNSYS